MAAPRPIRSQSYEQVHQLVLSAMRAHKPIAAVYKSCRRLFCPYLLGTKADGRLHALCYQYGGESGSGLLKRGSAQNWRCVELEKLTDVEILDERWFKPPNYSRHQNCITTIEEEVKDE